MDNHAYFICVGCDPVQLQGFFNINLKSYNNRTWLQDYTTRRMRINCNPVALTIYIKNLTFTRKYYSINYEVRKEMKWYKNDAKLEGGEEISLK